MLLLFYLEMGGFGIFLSAICESLLGKIELSETFALLCLNNSLLKLTTGTLTQLVE